MRVIAGRPVLVRARLEDEGGNLVDADPATTPTVAVVDGAGNAITGGTGDATHESTGVYTFKLPAQTRLDALTAVFSFVQAGDTVPVTVPVDIVGHRLVPLSRLRDDAELAALTTEQVLRVADTTEEYIREVLRYPAVPESARVTWEEPAGGPSILPPGVHNPITLYELKRVFANDPSAVDVIDPTTVLIVQGRLETGGGVNLSFLGGPTSAWWPGRYTIWCSHGLLTAPADLVRAAATLARYINRQTNYPERATRVVTEQTEFWLSSPGADRPTGLPEVDAVLMRYRMESPLGTALTERSMSSYVPYGRPF